MLCVQATVLPASKVLALRGGMDLGPVNADNFGGALKVAAGVTAAGAILEKYAGMGETSITGAAKGDTFTTNVVIAVVTGVISNVLYSVGDSGFDAGKVSAALWLASVALKLKDNLDVSTLTDNLLETAIALVSAVLAFA